MRPVSDKQIAEKYSVQGFPTILLLDNNGNKLKEYDGARTADALTEFVRQHSN